MKHDFTIYECGVTTPPPNWVFFVNNYYHINRVYYVIDEGAGYIYKGKKYKFLKDHVYILPHTVDIEYFLETKSFLHLFVDFSSSTALNYNEILCFHINEYPTISIIIEYLRCFLTEKLNGYYSGFESSHEIYEANERIRSVVSTLFYDIMEVFPISTPFGPEIIKSINFIQKNFHKPITRSELAKNVNLSESYFSNIFTQTTGISPYQYIKNHRFDIAISLISQGVSINEVAEKCGFSSVAAFSNSFKKKFGYSPSKYSKYGK